jgi:hypothetical protein
MSPKATTPLPPAQDDHNDWEQEEARAQQEIWSSIDETKFVAVMDKQPELWYGPDFVKAKIPEPPFLVKPFFPSGGLCLLHGKRGIGKSMLTMALARSVAMGEPFLGMFEARKGTVVVVQLDMVESVFHDRLQADPEFYSFDDWYTLTGVASVARATPKTPWVEQIVAVQPDLIIIDTLRKAHSWDENSSDTPARFYAKLRELFGFTAVVMIHHDRKSQSDSSGLEAAESFRGSGAWLDDVDCGLHVVKKRGALELEFSKLRTCDDIAGVPLYVDPDRLVLVQGAKHDDPSMSMMDLARAQARSFLIAQPDADQQDVYEHLKNQHKHTKARASIAAKTVFETS